jgi:hypothetical protein
MKFSHDFELTADSVAPIREAMNGMNQLTLGLLTHITCTPILCL